MILGHILYIICVLRSILIKYNERYYRYIVFKYFYIFCHSLFSSIFTYFVKVCFQVFLHILITFIFILFYKNFFWYLFVESLLKK